MTAIDISIGVTGMVASAMALRAAWVAKGRGVDLEVVLMFLCGIFCAAYFWARLFGAA